MTRTPIEADPTAEPLKVFVPLVHAARARGIARSLARAGHSMWLNAPDSIALTPFDVAMAQDRAREAFGPNVYCYGGEHILYDPPDVVIVGYEKLEAAIFDLHERLSRVKPVVLCCLSGNYQSHFDWARYRGSICSDEPSRALSRYNDTPALRYYELFEPDEFPYQPWSPGTHLVLPVFVKSMRQRFPFSADFCDRCGARLQDAFAGAVSLQLFDDATLTDAWAAMEAAPVTLAIKDQEGYGWAMLEALSKGRPIVYQAGLLRGMEFHKWTEPGVSGIGFTTTDDLVAIASDILEHPAAWQERQRRTAAIFRERYDGRATADRLNLFLADLVRLETLRWHPGRPVPDARERAAPYQPSLDPAMRQDWERVTGSLARRAPTHAIDVHGMGERAFVEGWDMGPSSATSLGTSVLDLSHLALEPGATLCLRHHRAKPVALSLCRADREVLVTVSLPCGRSRIALPLELGAGRMLLVGEGWSPRDEFGSSDARIISFDLEGIAFSKA